MGGKAHLYHQEILNEIKERAGKENARLAGGDGYIGTTKPCYPIKTAVTRQIAKDWIRRHPKLTAADYVRLLDSLSRGKSSDEILFIGELLKLLPKMRKTLKPRRVESWLNHVEGWCETDSICQSKFTAEEMLADWKNWKDLLAPLSKSVNVHKRRASLVLLTKPVRDSADDRLSNTAFANIERLKHESHILITKAISWLLRDLVKHHRREVGEYLRANEDTLPKVAIRETRNKLLMGKKSGR